MLYTHLEDYIYNLLLSINIKDVESLTIKNVSQRLNITIIHRKRPVKIGNQIFLRRENKRREWQDFGHELGHLLRHAGNQLFMHPLFIDLQEYQADYFAYHFCVPTFMLENLRVANVYEIMNIFNVEYEFALNRVEMYQSKICDQEVDNHGIFSKV